MLTELFLNRKLTSSFGLVIIVAVSSTSLNALTDILEVRVERGIKYDLGLVWG